MDEPQVSTHLAGSGLSTCSCLENPRDRGAWWAAVCGVTQSWTPTSQVGADTLVVGSGRDEPKRAEWVCPLSAGPTRRPLPHHSHPLPQREAGGRPGICWSVCLPAWQGRSGSIGSSDGGHPGREPVVRLGKGSIYSNGRCCPLVLSPQLGSPQRRETESDTNTPGPLGVRVCCDSPAWSGRGSRPSRRTSG